MKTKFIKLLSLLMFGLSSVVSYAQPADNKTANGKAKRTFAIWGHVRDGFTNAVVSGVKITLMDTDSTVIDTCTAKSYIAQDRISSDAWYRFDRPAVAKRFIIRASHPDYEDCYVNLNVKYVSRNSFFDAPWHYMKRRMKQNEDYELSLDSVVVKATRIKMAFRGDTLVFDASAFKLPDGSMLDALVRQMPGVTLDDKGVITVNGRKVDYLMLNGKNFFKGSNKVMLDNLPYYTVNNIKVYDRTTDKSRYVGKDIEQKEYVMDVNLKREYSKGFLGNATAGIGTGNHYMARIFGSAFTDDTRVSTYASINNINVSGNPNSQGEWNNNSSAEGNVTHRIAGLSIRKDGKKHHTENNTDIDATWTDKGNKTGTDSETFLSSGSNYALSDNITNMRYRNISFSNDFRKKLPIWLQSNTKIEFTDSRSDDIDRAASLDRYNRQYGEASEALDTMFADFKPLADIDGIINRTYKNTHVDGKQFHAYQNMEFNSKLPWGDNIEFQAKAEYNKNSQDTYQDFRLDYRNLPNDRRDIYISQPYRRSYLYGRGEYYLKALNNWTYRFYSLYECENKHNDRNYYRLDRLQGWNNIYHDVLSLPSADSLFLALSSDDTHGMRTTRRKWNSGFNIYYQKETDSTYLWLRFHLPVLNISDRIAYRKADVDTIASRNRTVMNGNINFTYKWNKKRNNVWANLWHETILPEMTSYVTFDSSNPLCIFKASGKLKNAEKWETSNGLTLAIRNTKMYFSIVGNYAHVANPIISGYYYNRDTGGYTYMETNGKSQTSGNVSPQLFGQSGCWTYNLSCKLEYGKGETAEFSSDMSDKRLYDNKSMNLAPYIAVGYQKNSLYAKLSGYCIFEDCKFESDRQTNYHTNYYEFALYAHYTIPGVKVQIQSDFNYIRNSSSLGYIPANENWLWNVSMSRSLLKGNRLTLQLAATDILKNISNYNYNSLVSSFAINTTKRIGRMLMFSANYNIFKQ